MNTWPARRSSGGDAALWVASIVLLLALAAFVFGGSREPGVGMLLLCILAAVLGAGGTVLLVLAIGYQRLVYSLTDSALRIQWLGRTIVVPYPAIQGIYTGQRLAGTATPRAPTWPGINVGSARIRGIGRLRFFATSKDQSALTLVTVELGGVVVSASDPQAFRLALIEHVEQCRDTGASVRTIQFTPATSAPWSALSDAWLPATVAAGAVLLLSVLGLIAFGYGSLADQVAVHFDASGRASQVASKSDLLRLPFLGLVCLVVNWALGVWVHPRERLLAHLLWLGAALVQLVLLIGVLRLVG